MILLFLWSSPCSDAPDCCHRTLFGTVVSVFRLALFQVLVVQLFIALVGGGNIQQEFFSLTLVQQRAPLGFLAPKSHAGHTSKAGSSS